MSWGWGGGEMGTHFFPDVVAVLAVLGFGTSVSAASILGVISVVTVYPSLALPLWAGATAWLCTETSARMQLLLQLLFTFAALQRCRSQRVGGRL